MIVFLDYDGTLTPIVPKPSEAKIEPKRKEFLKRLSEKHKVAIVTGRSFESFREVFGEVPETMFVVTSHGAKVYRGGELLENFFKGSLPDLRELKEKIKGMEGVLLEEKDGCFALHFREYRGNKEDVKRAFYGFVSKHRPVKIIEGKEILEAIYGGFDKGKAVENFLSIVGRKPGERLVYIGDDTTDLYALRKVKELGGIGVFVGESKPKEANLLLRDVEEVYSFLRTLYETSDDEQVVL